MHVNLIVCRRNRSRHVQVKVSREMNWGCIELQSQEQRSIGYWG